MVIRVGSFSFAWFQVVTSHANQTFCIYWDFTPQVKLIVKLLVLSVCHSVQGETQKFLDTCYKTQITSYMDMIYFYSSKYIPP